MQAITPRWEWRTFGTSFGPAEEAFARLTPERVQESDEIYVVGREGDTVKVRDALMDIKVLREVDGNGLEQWTPVMKAEFPVSAAEVGRVFEALRQPMPALDRAEYTLDQFLDELIAPADGVTAVGVHKRRVRYTIGGCTSEVTDVDADGHKTRTIAIEAEDPAAVIAAVREQGSARTSTRPTRSGSGRSSPMNRRATRSSTWGRIRSSSTSGSAVPVVRGAA